MADNNPTLRATLARLAGNVIAWEFTSTLEIGGTSVPGCISQLDETDKLEIAGRDILRALNVTVQTSLVLELKITEGDPAVLDGDNSWQIRNWHDSPDGALRTFTLMDSN